MKDKITTVLQECRTEVVFSATGIALIAAAMTVLR